MCTPKDFGNLCKCFTIQHTNHRCFPYILVWKSVPIFRISLVLCFYPFYLSLILKPQVSMHYALLQEKSLGSMQVYHFITFAIPEIYSSDPFFSNLSCNLNHPCMQHYTLKSDIREWGSGFNASNNFIIPSHTPKLSQNLLKIYRQLTPMIW
jgi:hypothetical protein